MTSFDYAVLAIIGLSILLSVMRGFIREILALASWVVAFYVAKLYASAVLPFLPAAIPNQSLKMLVAFILLFLATMLLSGLLTIALSQLFKQVGLSWIDRFFGAGFGLVRGVVIVLILVLLAGFTSLPKEPRWRNAMFSAPLEAMIGKCLPWLPGDIAKHVKYD